MHNRVRKVLLNAVFMPLLLCAASGSLAGAAQFSSLVDRQGNISFPAGFPNGYVYIGAWAVAGAGGVADIHTVYSRPSDVSQYRASGVFPDGAVLVKEVAEAVGSAHTTGKSFWPADTKTWFVMIKDSKSRFPSHPLWGEGWGWAQFDPKDTSKQIASDYKTDCLQCHVPAKALDWVYVYAYRSLGEKAVASAPKEARSGGLLANQGHRVPVMNAAGASAPVNADVAVAMGKAAFEETCSGCHSVSRDQGGTGPSLYGVMGRRAGTAPGFNFSEAMKNSTVVWTRENLMKHLADTRGFIPGNRMGRFFAGVDDAAKREMIAAYLETLK